MADTEPDVPIEVTVTDTIEQRIDKILVTVVLTTYKGGLPVGETTSKPLVLFRAALDGTDVFAFLDRAVAAENTPAR